ncbi:hypothetical protein C5Y44_12180 [Corynebacterium sp. J010B-136]|nr:hypothetical protein C5Y44_12180 [Corynebacterium sp. J010B-136]
MINSLKTNRNRGAAGKLRLCRSRISGYPAISFVLFPEDEHFEINTFSGIPLLYAKVGFYWLDTAYVIAGVLM